MKRLNVVLTGLLTAIATLLPSGAKAEKAFVYAVGLDDCWTSPIERNAEYYEKYKMYETAEGSKIYEGEFKAMSTYGYLRFYTKLSPDSEEGTSWLANTICPARTDEYAHLYITEIPMNQLGGEPYFTDTVKYKGLSIQNPGTFAFRLDNDDSFTLKITLDMNKNTLRVIDKNAKLLLINTDEIPTEETYSNFPGYRGKHFVNPGPVKFRIFNLYDGKIYGNSNGTVIQSGDGQGIRTFTASDKDDTFFTIPDWKGGTIDFLGNGKLNLNTITSAPADKPRIYVALKDEYPNMEINKENEAYLSSIYKYAEETSPGIFEGSGALKASYPFNLIYLDPSTGERIVYGPGEDTDLSVGSNLSISSSVAGKDNSVGYWTIPSRMEVDNFTFDKSSGKLTVNYKERAKSLYLIGQPQEWNVNSDEMKLNYIGGNRFYGKFNVAEGEAVFRFYTELGDWGMDGELPSLGSGSYDFTEQEFELDSDGKMTIHIVPGKGNISIPSWPGGDMYMLVDLNENDVYISVNPISYEAIDDSKLQLRYPYVAVESNGYITTHEMQKEGEFYITRAYIDKDSKIKFFGNSSPYIAGDEGWDSYNAVTFSELTYDEFGVGYTKAVINSGQGAKASEIKIASADDGYNYRFALNAETGELFVYRESTVVLAGPITEGKTPTLRNYKEFKGYIFDKMTDRGIILDIPKGKMSFHEYPLDGFSEDISRDKYAGVFKNGVITPNWGGLIAISTANWKGGKVLVSNNGYVYDFSAGLEAAVFTSDSHDQWVDELFEHQPMKETSPGVFTHSFNLKRNETGGHSALSFYIRDKQFKNSFVVGPCDYDSETGMRGYALLRNGSYSCDLGYVNYAVNAANLYEGTVDATLDLNRMKLDLNLKDGSWHSTFRTINSAEDVDSGNASILTSPIDPDMAVGQLSYMPQEYALNFASDNGKLIVPAEGTTYVNFKGTGVWTGSYTEIEAPAANKHLRAAAANAPQWKFTTFGRGNVMTLIDTRNKTVTFHSSYYNSHYYLTLQPDASFNPASMANPILMVESEKGNGIYKATVAIPYGGTGLYIHKEWSGAGTVYPSQLVTPRNDLEEGGVFGVPSFEGETINARYEGYNDWKISKDYEGGTVYLTFDSNECTLNLTTDSSEVKNVESAPLLLLRAVDGGIEVIAPEDTEITVFNISGIPVFSGKLNAGTNRINLPSGIYIAAGTKLLVK